MTLHEYLASRRLVIETAIASQTLADREDLRLQEMAAKAEIDAIDREFPPPQPKPAPDAPGWWWAEHFSYPVLVTQLGTGLYCEDWSGNFRPATEVSHKWLGPIEKPKFE